MLKPSTTQTENHNSKGNISKPLRTQSNSQPDIQLKVGTEKLVGLCQGPEVLQWVDNRKRVVLCKDCEVLDRRFNWKVGSSCKEEGCRIWKAQSLWIRYMKHDCKHSEQEIFDLLPEVFTSDTCITHIPLTNITKRIQTDSRLPLLDDDGLLKLFDGQIEWIAATKATKSSDVQLLLVERYPDVVVEFKYDWLTEKDRQLALAILANDKKGQGGGNINKIQTHNR